MSSKQQDWDDENEKVDVTEDVPDKSLFKAPSVSTLMSLEGRGKINDLRGLKRLKERLERENTIKELDDETDDDTKSIDYSKKHRILRGGNNSKQYLLITAVVAFVVGTYVGLCIATPPHEKHDGYGIIKPTSRLKSVSRFGSLL